MHYSHYKRPLLWLLLVYMGCLALFYSPHPSPDDVSRYVSDEPVSITANVAEFPVLKEKSNNVVLRVLSVDGKETTGYVYARFAQGVPAWKSTLQISGKLVKPYAVSLLGNFDWKKYLATQNIFAELEVSSFQTIQEPPLLYRWIFLIRQDILHVFARSFSPDLAAIAGGILLGEKTQINPSLYTAFQDSGAVHLLVASGGNVAFVTLMVYALCGLFALGRKKTAFLALCVAGVYTLVAGADAPLTRAYFMSVCAVLGYVLHRNSGVFQGLILSCLVILLLKPACLFETGFQMSFLATLGIVLCLNHYEISYKWPRWFGFFSQIFLATLSAQLALLPIFANVFYKVSWVGLLSNMILVPFASFLMGISFLFYLFSCLHLGFLLKTVTAFSLWLFKSLVLVFGQKDFSSVLMPAWKTGTILLYYAGLFLLFHLPKKEFIKQIYKPVLGGMLLLLLFQTLWPESSKVWLLNEWNKNSILLLTSDGKRILIGAEIEAEKIAKAVLYTGGKQVDAVLINQHISKQLKQVQQLKQYLAVKEVIVPFQDLWPGEEKVEQGWRAKAEWGLLLNRENNFWHNRGYSGGRDSVSYQISGKDFSFLTAGNGRFILSKAQKIENQRNGTKKVVF